MDVRPVQLPVDARKLAQQRTRMAGPLACEPSGLDRPTCKTPDLWEDPNSRTPKQYPILLLGHS